MKRNIACPCGKNFAVEAEEKIDLDANAEQIELITSGAFMNFVCPGCGKIHKPEYPCFFTWASKAVNIEFLSELERGEFYRRKKDPPGAETIIGYAELADRIAVIRDGLEPAVIEALKYFLLLRAEESCHSEEMTDAEISVWYESKNQEGIEFHLRGIRAGEIAVIRAPISLYEKTLADFVKHPKSEVFAALRTRSYLSVQNTLRPDALK
jgi:hypothetical protein